MHWAGLQRERVHLAGKQEGGCFPAVGRQEAGASQHLAGTQGASQFLAEKYQENSLPMKNLWDLLEKLLHKFVEFQIEFLGDLSFIMIFYLAGVWRIRFENHVRFLTWHHYENTLQV